MSVHTAPAALVTTGKILEALMRDSMRIDVFVPTQMGGNFFALVGHYTDGVWTLTEDNVLTWYPGNTINEDGYEADFSVVLDCTTPRYVAAATHAIITAPADQRAYVASVECPNLVQG